MSDIVTSVLQNNADKAQCPDCSSKLNIPCDIKEGEILSCPGCGAEFEVKKVSNGGDCLELQEFTMEGEDWGE